MLSNSIRTGRTCACTPLEGLTFDDWIGAFAAVDSFNSSDSRLGMLLSAFLSHSFSFSLSLPSSILLFFSSLFEIVANAAR